MTRDKRDVVNLFKDIKYEIKNELAQSFFVQ